jgi:hypothetical protein
MYIYMYIYKYINIYIYTYNRSLKDSVAPLEESSRKVLAEKEALEGVKVQLQKDIEYWRERLHSLVARYSDVDPEEHRLLQTRFEDSEKVGLLHLMFIV